MRAPSTNLSNEGESAELAAGRLADDVELCGVAAPAADVAHHPRDARVAVFQHVLQIALRMLRSGLDGTETGGELRIF